MDKEVEVFSRLLEKNFANQVIDEFVLVKVEKEYPSDLDLANITIGDSYCLLESCFTIWDVSSRLIIQTKKTLSANSKYILRLRLLCCRFLYFIFRKQHEKANHDKSKDKPKKQDKIPSKEPTESPSFSLSQPFEVFPELPTPFKDNEVLIETLKIFVRCAQNCHEVEDNARLTECLGFIKFLEEEFFISELIFTQSNSNITLYLLANRWLLQLYVKEDQEIPYQIVTNKFPQLLQVLSEHPLLEEKEQLVSLILMVICTLMTSNPSSRKNGLARYSLNLLQTYNHLFESVRPDLSEMYKKMSIYSLVQRDSIEKTDAVQLYEQLTACSGDRLTEYLKLLVEAKVRLDTSGGEEAQKDDMDFIMKKLELLITQYDVESEEFSAFVDELCTLYGSLGHQYYSFFLAQYLETSIQAAQNAKAKTRKVDAVVIKLIQIWETRLEKKEALTENEAINLENHAHLVIKCIIKDKVSGKKLILLEKRMLQLAKTLVLREYYKMCYEFLENLIVLIKKDHAQMHKELCILQIENCYYLQKKEIKDVFITYDSYETNKDDFVYNICRLKVLLVLSASDDVEAQKATREIPDYLNSIVESSNFDGKTFFLLVMEFLKNTISTGTNGRPQNSMIMLKEFFIILKKGLEKVIDYHLGGQESEPNNIQTGENKSEAKDRNTFALFKLFCVYLNSFQGLFEKVKMLNMNPGEQNSAIDIIGHDAIRDVLEVGFLILETFRVFCEKYLAAYSKKEKSINFCWLVDKVDLDYIDKFYWDIAILVGYLNMELSFAQRFIFLSLKIKLMKLILSNLAKFGEFLQNQEVIEETDIDTEFFLQFVTENIKDIALEDSSTTSLIKILLLYISNALCMLKRKDLSPIDALSNQELILKCLELNRSLLIKNCLDDKAKSFLQYHCLIEFEYLIITSPESVRMFLEDFCIQTQIEAQLFLVFAEIAKKLNRKEEYLLCLRGHVKASIKDTSVPVLSLECYVELVENCQSIEEEVCYLRQLLAFLDDNIESLKAENALEDLKQEVEYLCAISRTREKGKSEDKKEFYMVKALLLEEIETRYAANIER